MRKLGKSGQSLVFYGSADVERQLLECVKKVRSSDIDVSDVLFWSISETFDSISRSVALWAVQGLRHQRHHAAWSQLSSDNHDDALKASANCLLEKDTQTLEERYLHEQVEFNTNIHNEKSTSTTRSAELDRIKKKCDEFIIAKAQSTSADEEQEREIAPETEVERQIERSKPITFHKHEASDEVKRFVTTGELNTTSDAFVPAFSTLSKTGAKQWLELEAYQQDVLVTVDFARTVVTKDDKYDDFLRPVHWVLSSRDAEEHQYLIISPFEANELLPSIFESGKVRLHVYSARTALASRSLEDLSFCAMPPLPTGQSHVDAVRYINLFAGQTYLKSYDEYLRLWRLLGLCYRTPGNAVLVRTDGFIERAERPKFDAIMAQVCPFSESPVGLLRRLLDMRSKGQGFRHSHMGKIVFGARVLETDFIGHASD